MRVGLRASIFAFAVVLASAYNSAPAQAPYRETIVSHGGTVQGSVKMSSLPSSGAIDRMTKDEAVCGKRKPSPRLMTGGGGRHQVRRGMDRRDLQGEEGDPSGEGNAQAEELRIHPSCSYSQPGR